MKEASKESDYFYNINDIIRRFNLPKESTFDFLSKDESSIISYNCIKYDDTYYINITGLLYFCYMYKPYKDGYDMFLHLIKHLYSFKDIRNSISDNYLIFNNEGSMGFVYIANSGNLTKIGCSCNPIKRLKNLVHDIDLIDDTTNMNLLYLLRFSSKEEAIKYERELHRRFDKLRIKGEWFNYDDEIARVVTINYFKFVL